jgi:hypothetical protein
MSIQTFGDRFTYANQTMAALVPTVDSLSDQQLASASPQLAMMGAMVRRHSILLRSAKLSEIYRVITEQADPRIGLRLAAAKNDQGINIFADIEQVKAAMFGPASDTDTNFVNSDLNLFVDGVRRVSVALAVSWMIGQFAQVEEQRRHGELLEKQALADLEFLIKTYEKAQISPKLAQEERNQAFYFEDKELNLMRNLLVEVYIPNAISTNWALVGNYSGTVKTGTIVADLCDVVNNLTLNVKESNVIASPVLAGIRGLHRMDVASRMRDTVISHELISVRMRFLGFPLEELPFCWGVDTDHLNTDFLNSVLVWVDKGSVQTLTVGVSKEGEQKPTVLYFRRGPVNGAGLPIDAFGQEIPVVQWANANLTFRISPTMSANETVVMQRQLNGDPLVQQQLDTQRYSEVPLVLLNKLFELKGQSIRALGALIRNDDPQQPNPMAALELIAYTLNQLETWMILDVIELPADIQMAVGDLRGPITAFSNKPRSIRVAAKFTKTAAADGGLSPTQPGTLSCPKVVPVPESSRLRDIKYRVSQLEDRWLWQR